MVRTSFTTQAIDDVLAGSFPASDPPAWTTGIARLAPEPATPLAVTGTAQGETSQNHPSDVIDVALATDSDRTLRQALVSLVGAAGIALVVPLAILAVGTPVALTVSGLLEVAQWFVAMSR